MWLAQCLSVVDLALIAVTSSLVLGENVTGVLGVGKEKEGNLEKSYILLISFLCDTHRVFLLRKCKKRRSLVWLCVKLCVLTAGLPNNDLYAPACMKICNPCPCLLKEELASL